MRTYAMVIEDDPEPQPIDFDQDGNYDEWMAKEAEASSMIRLSSSTEVRHLVKGMRNCHAMWNTPQTNLDTARSYIGRQDILRQLHACRPKEDKPIKAYFTKLSNCHIELDHTDHAIIDQDSCTQLLTSLWSQYAMILMITKHRRPLPTPEQAMHDLLEE